jgi:hypothetical protein
VAKRRSVVQRIRDGELAAPFCMKAPARPCPKCGEGSVLPLGTELLAVQPDATTHVCHPLLGGCNWGFEDTSLKPTTKEHPIDGKVHP